VAVVVSINLCWHFFRAWLPKMLRETHDYSRGATNLFTSAFYIATDVGCIASGLAIKRLATRKFSVHTSRVIVFSACALLTSLSVQVAMLNASPLMLGLLLIIGAGALGLFPIYYSLTQELSVKNQGLVIGLLAAIAWIVSSLMHTRIGHWIDSTKSYSTILVIAGLAPLAAAIVLIGFWGKTKEEKAIPETR
jgi:ACS family hexuronate transporter-like MFS transporter